MSSNVKPKPKSTREGNKADGRRLGCCKSEGMQEDEGGNMHVYYLREKIGNLTSIQQIHTCDLGARHRAKNCRRQQDKRIQPDAGELTV